MALSPHKASAQGSGTAAGAETTGAGGPAPTAQLLPNGQLIAQSTVLPTDIVPLPSSLERSSALENLQYGLYRRLPRRLYFNVNAETTFRLETNPFQYPTKRKLLSQFRSQLGPNPPTVDDLSGESSQLGKAGSNNVAFRVVPNVTVGWALTPYTSVYSNYFLLRDQLFRNSSLNTVAQSVSAGIQRRANLSRRTGLTLDGQFREFFQTKERPVFDFLPSITLSQTITPRMSAFASTLLQLRGRRYFQAPTKEIDPFYTVGLFYQHGLWTYSNSGTFVQNFRQPFGNNATVPINSYAFIVDFEVARRLSHRLSALQTFVRAEPVYNLHTHNRPGFAGMDFRLFWGVRMAFGKTPLSTDIEELRKQLQESEAVASPASSKSSGH
ncbi:MAG TPA: hypothetical protein V6D22_08560 [Candidatus Obscuribacterales bacterium]